MAVIFEDSLKKDISSGNFAPVYIIFGDDSYLKKHYRDSIAKKAFGGDEFFNLQRFSGDIELQDVFDAVNQFPIMADRKAVVLSDYDFEHASKNDFDKLCSLLTDCNDECVLILDFDSVEFDAKKSAKAKKLISSAEKGGGRCAEINHRSITALAKMLTDAASKRGCKFGDMAARYLIEISGNDLNTLRNELDKLCAYVGGGEIIKETVDLISVKSVDASVYDYVKQIFAGNISGALKSLDDMFFMRIDPMAILYTASSSYIDMFRMSAAEKSAINKSEVAADFAYKHKAFVLDRAAQNLRKFNNKKLSLSLEALTDADKALKSFGADERTLLEQLTVKLVYIIAKGESVD